MNLDFADVKAIMRDGGVAVIGVGVSDTTNRVEEAVKGALANPLLDVDYTGASGALIHVSGGPDLTLDEVAKVGDLVTEAMDQDANVIWGARVLEEMQGKITVMTIMTGVRGSNVLGQASKRESLEKKQGFFEGELGIELV